MAASAAAQADATASNGRAPTDIAVTFTAENANPVGGGGNFWLKGGNVEMGNNLWHGLGFAVNGGGSHSSSIGTQGIPLSLWSLAAGPRYRVALSPHYSPKVKSSVFGEFLIGGTKGFNSYFPNPGGAATKSDSLVFVTSVAIDMKLTHLLALRPIQAAWVRSKLSNGTTNVQNDIRLSAGIVFQFN